MAALGEGTTALPRILCGHRHGPDGAVRINAAIEQRRGVAGQRGLYQDRPILITVNDDLTGLRNGDTGHLAKQGDAWMACIDGGSSPVEVSRLPAHETAFALTIHKTQGSEYESVVVALPARPSPVLTRELLYTGITRSASGVLKEQAEEVASDRAKNAALKRMVGLCYMLRDEIQADNILAFGEILHENWELKKSLASRISNSTIDDWYDTARRCGATGGKILGAGAGGFLLLSAPPERHAAICHALPALRQIPFAFERYGSQIIFYQAD
jgi:hypothetical protein